VPADDTPVEGGTSMTRRAMKVCSTPTCPALVPTGTGQCDRCQAERDRARGTAAQRGYTSRGHQRFRRTVLQCDPVCVVCRTAPSTVADHYPLSRRQLVDARLDPDNPDRGRGVCVPCHGKETAMHQPGGWNAR
jgi:5-methylcytosine-specific restriction enzyme A